MTFLKKLGIILAKATSIVAGVAPLFPQYSSAVDKVTDTIEGITDIIITVEAVGEALKLTGPQKLEAAIPLVTQIILKSDMLAGKKIDQPELFKTGVTKVTNGMVDILNSLEADIKTEKVV